MDTPSDLLGEPTSPDDLELGPVQRLVLRQLRALGTLTKDEAGALAHNYRGRHAADSRCRYCAVDGADILAALVRRGYAEKTGGGGVQLARPLFKPDAHDDFPEGF